MSRLDGFSSKNFIEKIALLNQMAIDGDESEVEALIDISQHAKGDPTIYVMFIHTLHDLLFKHEQAAIKLLSNPSFELVRLALNVIGRQSFHGAGDALIELYQKESDAMHKSEILQTMQTLDGPRFAPIFIREAKSKDDILSALAIKALGIIGDHGLDTFLQVLVTDNEALDRYHHCSVSTAQAIETMAQLGGTENLHFLALSIHHKNPTARRLIQEHLSAMGEAIIPYLSQIFDEGDTDQKVLAANLIAQTSGKAGGDLLLSVLDQGKAEDHNVRFAVYEALGAFPAMKTFICLIEALSEPDLLILISVLSALNRYEFPFVAAKVAEKIDVNTALGQTIIKALVDSESDKLFKQLFLMPTLTQDLKKVLCETLSHHRSQVLEALRAELIPQESCQSSALDAEKKVPRILAADDSLSIRRFYESALSAAGYHVTTAEDGAAALMKLQFDSYDLLITDLNMPNMDGIQLAQRIKSTDSMKAMPIIMVTTESEQSQRSLAQKQGVDSYVTKPIKIDQLMDSIRKFL